MHDDQGDERMATTEQAHAASRLQLVFWVGLALALIGAVLVGLNWPGTEQRVVPCSTTFDEGCSATGERLADVATGEVALLVLGGASALVGQLLLTVSLIGWAVSLGIRHARR